MNPQQPTPRTAKSLRPATVVRRILLGVTCLFALVGLAVVVQACQTALTRGHVEEIEAARTWDPDLLWNLPHGKPILMFNPDYETTLFFFEGFRGQIGAGHYRDWFEYLHTERRVNIVAPIIGVQGYPFALRNRDWHYVEDMRSALQIYDAYCVGLKPGHRVVVASMSFGALANAAIAAKSPRAPEACVFISPLNPRLDYRSQNPVVAWLSTQTAWLQHVMPYNLRGKNPARATLWDIVNDDLNRAVFERYGAGMVNPEENLAQATTVSEAAVWIGRHLLPQVRNRDVLVLSGDSDLYFTQEGFAEFSSTLEKAGNRVQHLVLAQTGHMVLHDNGGPQAKQAIEALLAAASPARPAQ